MEGSIITRRPHCSELSLGEAHSTVLKAQGSVADHQLFLWYFHQTLDKWLTLCDLDFLSIKWG